MVIYSLCCIYSVCLTIRLNIRYNTWFKSHALDINEECVHLLSGEATICNLRAQGRGVLCAEIRVVHWVRSNCRAELPV
jgi:hypothetical protein